MTRRRRRHIREIGYHRRLSQAEAAPLEKHEGTLLRVPPVSLPQSRGSTKTSAAAIHHDTRLALRLLHTPPPRRESPCRAIALRGFRPSSRHSPECWYRAQRVPASRVSLSQSS